jgi:methylthioribulose-1-phosphate dehydratase
MTGPSIRTASAARPPLPDTDLLDTNWLDAADTIVEAGRRLDRHGWVPATAGNISRRLPDGRIAITRSGGHKGFLTRSSVIEVDLEGCPLLPTDRPSAETLLHCQLYRDLLPEGAVLHGHSVAATVLSMLGGDRIVLSGYEVLKVFENQTTHDTSLTLPIFDNDQDIARLSRAVASHLPDCRMGYLIRGHGVYVWGPSMDIALARLEGLEFLLACALERRHLERSA